MTIAALVLGFREPVVLAAAVPLYKKAGFDVYVHVDAKIAIADYAAAMGDAAKDCIFIEKRLSIFWAGFSMIEATLELMRQAIAGGYENYVLVSDDSFPIRTPHVLRAKISTDHQRISARAVQSSEIFADRYRNFYSFDHVVTSLHGRPIENASFDDTLIERVERLARRRRLGKADLKLHYGSQWWSLTREAVALILEIDRDRIDVRESFEFSAVPDESYVQSILMNFYPEMKRVQSPMLVDWTRQPRPYVFQSLEDVKSRVGEDHCFVRKITARHQELLLDLIRSLDTGERRESAA
jgi:hypothetical protein